MKDNKEQIHSIRLDYGDASFFLYRIRIPKKSNNAEPIFHEHRFYELHFAHSGTHDYQLKEGSVRLGQNQMLIIPPYVSHVSVQNTDWDYEYSVLSLSLEQTDGESGFLSFFQNALNSCALTPISVSPSLWRKTAELTRSELYGAIKGECYLKMLGSSLIYELFESLNNFKAADTPMTRAVDDSNRLILLDTLIYDSRRSLTNIAETIGYSPRHTSRLIKATYGRSLSDIRRAQEKNNADKQNS